MNNDVAAIITELMDDPEQLSDYVRAVEHLLRDRDALLSLIPACAAHGIGCIAHAREWICEQRAKDLGLGVKPSGLTFIVMQKVDVT